MTAQPQTGCYGDGALGHQHCRERLAEILEDTGHYSNHTKILKDSLAGAMPDDAWDEDDAIDLLNSLPISQVDGAAWGFQDGDFGLWPIEAD